MNDFLTLAALIALGLVVVCGLMAAFEWIDRELRR